MKKIPGLLTLALLAFLACKNNADKTGEKQNQQEKMRNLKIVRYTSGIVDVIGVDETKKVILDMYKMVELIEETKKKS